MSEPYLTSLNYPDCLDDYYQNFCDLPGFVLLQSGDMQRGRFDILSAYPYDRIKINQDTPDKQAALQRLRQALIPKLPHSDLPFQGGAIGYISYDFGAQLLGINSQPQESLADLSLLDMGLYDWAIIVDHHLKQVVVFCAHERSETIAILAEVVQLWEASAQRTYSFKVNQQFSPLISKARYKDAFFSIHHYLKEGRSYQVNFTQAFHAYYSGSTWEIYRKINSSNPVPYSAYLNLESTQLLSFSPERFLLNDGGVLLTSPIKGTVGRAFNPEIDEQLKQQLLVCDKNRAENIMIVDLLRNDLSKISKAGSVKVTSLCEAQSFTAVHHLVSTIVSQSKDNIHPVDAFFSCFPGGSITGAPKIESMKIIHEQEAFARGIYCGSIAYFSRHGRFDSNIAIRTLIAKNNLLHLAAGGGIVIDSNWEDEYRECYVKISSIINALET